MRYPVITIRQPWAALIVSGVKDVENRSWPLPERYIGIPVLIHASARPLFSAAEAFRIFTDYDVRTADIPHNATLTGHIIGKARFSTCWAAGSLPLSSRWCEAGDVYWWRVSEAHVLAVPIPAKGRLGIWSYELDI